MARAEFASLCILLFLTAFAQCGLGQTVGSTHVYNGASNDIIHGKYLTHKNGTVTIIHHATLAKDTAAVFVVPEDVECVRTSYLQLPAETLGQVVLDWCSRDMPVDFLPNCYWIINDAGFSVGYSESSTLRFVAGWKKIA